MNVLSLFDGKSSGFTACELAGIEVGTYYSAEIDKYAIQVSNAIHPNQTRLGSVTEWRDWDIDWSSIDMIFGGFPCQAWSMAGKQLGDKDERGMLFWVMLDIMKHVSHHNPKVDFLIENVKMKKEFEEYVTFHMNEAVGDVHKILINSALVSAQNRNRYYWTSFPVTQPGDRGLVLADVIESDPESPTVMSDKFCTRNAHILRDDVSGKAKSLSAMEYVKNGRQGDYINVKCGRVVGRKINPETGKRDDYNPELSAVQRFEPRLDDKSGCLTTVQKDNQLAFCSTGRDQNNDRRLRAKSDKCPTLTARYYKGVKSDGAPFVYSGDKEKGDLFDYNTVLNYRKLTPRECFRLQTVPEHYIDKILGCGVSNSQLYKIAGNGWTDEVIAHILRGVN
ncbi:cytosine specific methyltransferase [Vibrio phage vB_VhaS_MAG7]|nr:cytosine specific methyltransferase [Vibrio phage vB_VhaS_MAG7]